MKYHQDLTSSRWNKFNLFEQMANIGSEVFRTISWKNKNNPQYSRDAFWRALELIDLAVADPKNRFRLKEILRMRECLVDYFVGDNEYKSTDKSWQKYFYAFNWAARKNY